MSSAKSFTKLIKYNLMVLLVLIVSIELSTRIVSLVTGKGFFLGLDELEAWDSRISSIYQWHPFTGFIFKDGIDFSGGHPNQKEKHRNYTDKHGFLSNGPQIAYEKAPNEIRIATIGGSTTANINLSFNKNWPGYLGDLIQKKFPSQKITVINAGIPGFTSSQSLGNLALRVMPFSPDIVLIYHAYNDLKAVRYDREFAPDYSHIHDKPYGFHKPPNLLTRALHQSMLYVRLKNKKRTFEKQLDRLETISGTSIEQSNRLDSIPDFAAQTFYRNMRALIAVAKSGGSQVILSTFATLHDPTQDYRNQKIIGKLSALKKSELMSLVQFTPGLTLNAIFSGIGQYNQIISDIATIERCDFVDNASAIGHLEEYFVDRVHFSAEGAKKMAESYYPAVEKIVSDKISLMNES